MAVINKLRNSGIVIGAIVVALVAFLLTELISSAKKTGSQIKDNSVGVINGEPIQTGEYEMIIKGFERDLLIQTQGKPLDESQTQQIKQRAWQKIFSDKVLLNEYSELGLSVSEEEMENWMFSADPHPTIKYYFGPIFKEGEDYDPNKVKTYVNQMVQNPEAKQQINQVYQAVKGDVLDNKYTAMVKNSIYVTNLEAEQNIALKVERMDGKIVNLKISDINQDSVSVSDEELKAYLAANKDDFKQEQSVDFEYVKWDIIPSSQDTLTAVKNITAAYEEFKSATNDSVYLDFNGTKGIDSVFTTPANLPRALSRNLSKLNTGDMYGPDFDNGVYSVYKILETAQDSNTYVNTSHVLFKTGAGKKEELVKAKANEVLAQLRKGTISWDDAVKQSEDLGSARDGGYIGWNTDDGSLVKEYIDFALSKNKGDIGIAKSQFGFHIIKINEAKTSKLMKYGEVSQVVDAGRNTRKEVLDVATKFRRELQGKDHTEFQTISEKNKMFPSIARNVEEKTKQVSGVADSKNITDWAFEKSRKEGDISPVLSIGNTRYVVHITNIRNEGYAELDDVKEAVTQAVKKEKSTALLVADMEKAIKGASSMEQVAINLKTIAQDFNGFSADQSNIPQVGNDDILRGVIASSKVKEIVGPVEGINGVYCFMITKREADKSAKMEIKEIKDGLVMTPKQSAKQWTENALKKMVDFKDTRYKFYD